jgi:hypothetical protein
VHLLAFGDLAGGVWGVGWFTGDGSESAASGAVAAAGEEANVLGARAELGEGVWRIAGDGLELTARPVGSEQEDGLAHVQGNLRLGGGQRAVDGLGWRQSRPGLLGEDWVSLDQVASWLADDYGLSLTARLSGPGQRHDQASITAEVLGAQAGAAEDPRLSTTCRPSGELLRVGIELWLARGEEDDLYPFRASGEVIGAPLNWALDGISLSAHRLRWHSRDREGPGIFLRGRR